jgi:hypothetical protein
MLGKQHANSYFVAMVIVITNVAMIPWLLFATNCARSCSVIISNSIICLFVCLSARVYFIIGL